MEGKTDPRRGLAVPGALAGVTPTAVKLMSDAVSGIPGRNLFRSGLRCNEEQRRRLSDADENRRCTAASSAKAAAEVGERSKSLLEPLP